MSEYLTELGSQATVGDVFHGLYEQADQLIAQIDHLRRGGTEESSGKLEIPGTPLEMELSQKAGDCVGVINSTTRINSWDPNSLTNIRLLSRTERVDGTERTPSQVAGYRYCEQEGDYSMSTVKSNRGQEAILVRLGGQGLGRAPKPSAEPFGIYTAPGSRKINRLDRVQHQQLKFVSVGILQSIGAVELIKEGEDIEVVFAATGRTVATSEG